jgi:hypothetical protein
MSDHEDLYSVVYRNERGIPFAISAAMTYEQCQAYKRHQGDESGEIVDLETAHRLSDTMVNGNRN